MGFRNALFPSREVSTSKLLLKSLCVGMYKSGAQQAGKGQHYPVKLLRDAGEKGRTPNRNMRLKICRSPDILQKAQLQLVDTMSELPLWPQAGMIRSTIFGTQRSCAGLRMQAPTVRHVAHTKGRMGFLSTTNARGTANDAGSVPCSSAKNKDSQSLQADVTACARVPAGTGTVPEYCRSEAVG